MQRGHNHRALKRRPRCDSLKPGANALKRSQIQTYGYGEPSRALPPWRAISEPGAPLARQALALRAEPAPPFQPIGLRSVCANLFRQQLAGMHAQLVGNAHQNQQAWISLPSFNSTQISEVYLRIVRELFLTQLSADTQPPNICAHERLPVHNQKSIASGL